VSEVKHRGWSRFITKDEYEARLEAITPKPNNEAEEHIPPAPFGKVRRLDLRRNSES
jgi:hypothetical protein